MANALCCFFHCHWLCPVPLSPPALDVTVSFICVRNRSHVLMPLTPCPAFSWSLAANGGRSTCEYVCGHVDVSVYLSDLI